MVQRSYLNVIELVEHSLLLSYSYMTRLEENSNYIVYLPYVMQYWCIMTQTYIAHVSCRIHVFNLIFSQSISRAMELGNGWKRLNPYLPHIIGMRTCPGSIPTAAGGEIWAFKTMVYAKVYQVVYDIKKPLIVTMFVIYRFCAFIECVSTPNELPLAMY